MTLLPYVGSVINLGNSFSQATRPKNVGQMSDLIQEYRESTDRPTRDGWESFYNDRIGLDKIDIATDKTWDYVQRIKDLLKILKKNLAMNGITTLYLAKSSDLVDLLKKRVQ